MKKSMKFFGAFLIASILLTSCGNDSNSQEKQLKDYEKSAMERMKKYEKMGESDNEITNSSDEEETESEWSSSNDCEQFCSDYEAFVNDYVSFMKKYKANPSDMSILSEYSEMMKKASEMQENSSDWAADPAVVSRNTKALY